MGSPQSIERARDQINLVTGYLAEHGEDRYEGSSMPEGLAYLADLAVREGADLIAEVGFNTGLSSFALLSSRPDAHVVSFDIGTHTYVGAAKRYIDMHFPGRHTLILGDSRETVPRYAEENPDTHFDLVFIDGGHDYDVAAADIANFRSLSRAGTAVVMDDLMPWMRWGVGPTEAWSEAVRQGVVVQEELVQDGQRVVQIAPPAQRAWAMGRYTAAP